MGDSMLEPTPEEINDAATFLKIAKGFLDRGYSAEMDSSIQPFGDVWIRYSKPGMWKSYTGIALFGGVVNLASLEAMMHYAYMIIFASGNDFVWQDELLGIIE